jgi:hypothetical protein
MEPSACECDESLEVGFEFFVSRGESAKVFESGEAAFDTIALCEQGDGLGAVVDLSGSDGKIHRQSQLIGEQMDLGRQTSAGTPQSLVLAPFLRPVAAC